MLCWLHGAFTANPASRGCGYYLGAALLAIVLLILVGAIGEYVEQQNKSPVQKEVEHKQNAKISFAAMGAKQLRDSMRNPDSFKLSKLVIMEDGAVCYHYRAQNGFGGMNVGMAVLAPDGRLRTDDQNGFRALWKSECAGKTGIEETGTVEFLLHR